jgi:serine/threonine-protein kinase
LRDDPSPSVSFHTSAARRAVAFGPFRFDFADRTLSRDGVELHAPPRVLALLAHLLERPGRVVSKQSLVDAVWPDAAVGETSLTEAIGILRQTLGDSPQDPVYIQTLHRRGYRFVAPLRVEAQAAQHLTAVPDRRAADAAEPQPESHAPPAFRPGRIVTFAAVFTGAVLALVTLAWWSIPRTRAPIVTRATITLPADQSPAPGLTAQPILALSPDGRRLVYTAGSSGAYRLFSRSIDQFAAVAIPGTDNAHAPFFSPDGRSIGFFADYGLKVMQLPDGRPLDLAPASSGYGGWWHDDGTIVFATGRELLRVPATGGTATPIRVEGVPATSLRYPQMLPDGRTIVATEWRATVRTSRVIAIDAPTGAVRPIADGVYGRWVSTGHVLYLKNGTLMAAALDGRRGDASMVPDVMTGLTGAGHYATASGTLLYAPEAPTRRNRTIVAIDTATGDERALPFERRAFQNVAISNDGTRIAATIYESGASDIWVGDLARGTLSKVPSSQASLDPVWSADNATVFFSSTRGGRMQVYGARADASEPPQLVAPDEGFSPAAAAQDGTLILQRIHPTRHLDLHLMLPDRRIVDWVATDALETRARISPDGRWVVYQSLKSGRWEVYLRLLRTDGPASNGERQVSTSGGVDAAWSADGRVLYYLWQGVVMKVPFENGTLGSPRTLLQDDDIVALRSGGNQLLALKRIEEHRPISTLNLVVNWMEELRSR